MWRGLYLAALLAVALPTAGVAAAAPASNAEYRLGVGDQVRVKVFEWRSTVGDVHEWSALNAEYRVGADGAVSLPLVGAVKAGGMTVEEFAGAISDRLQSSMKLTIRPQASVEVVKYRPFYILGDVNKPGEYSYRPGLSVLEAISIAGGMYRVSDPGLLFNTAGELRVLRIQYSGLLARRARLEAELNAAAAIAFPPELLREQNDPTVARLIRREQSMFAARRDAVQAQLNSLAQLKSLLYGEVGSLQSKAKNVDRELVLLKEQLNTTASLVKEGLAIVPRQYALQQTQLETEDRRLDLDTAALRAKEDIERADQAMLELRNKTRNGVQVELADIERKIPEIASRIGTSAMIVDRQPLGGGGPAANSDRPPSCLILRPAGGKVQEIHADETTPVAPGDTVKILRPSEPFSPAAANPANADGLAESGPAAASPGR